MANVRIRSTKILGGAALILFVVAAARAQRTGTETETVAAPNNTTTAAARITRRRVGSASASASSAAIVRSHDLFVANARATSPLTPDDPGGTEQREGWTRLQWNFAGPDGCRRAACVGQRGRRPELRAARA